MTEETNTNESLADDIAASAEAELKDIEQQQNPDITIDTNMVSGMMKAIADHKGDGIENSALIDELMSETSLFDSSRQKYYSTLDRYEANPFVLAICQAVSEYLFDDDEEEAIALEVQCKHRLGAKYAKDVAEMFRSVQIADLLDRNLETLLIYGELPLHIETAQKLGVTEVSEKYAPGEIVTVFEGSDPIQYWRYPTHSGRRAVQWKTTGHQATAEAEEVAFHKVVVFRMPGKRLRLSLDKKHNESYFVQASRSFIWPAVDKLQTLCLHDAAKTAMRLKQLSRPILVGLQLPQGTSGKVALRYVKKFEKLLNSSAGSVNDMVASGDMQKLVSTLSGSNIKVIPQFEGGKGELQRSDFDKEIRDELANESIEANKGYKIEILNTLGIPPDLYFAEDAKVDLRAYSRFYRKLKKMSRAITHTLSAIAVNHIVQKYGDKSINMDDFVISTGSNSSIEALDAAEHVNIILDNMNQLIDFQTNLRDSGILEEGETMFSKEKIVTFLKTELGKSGARGVVDLFSDADGVDPTKTQL